MKASVVRIGNSRGIRIPKTVLEQCGLGSVVELEVRRGELIVRSAAKPRSGWEEAFRQMAQRGDDVLLDGDSLPSTQWDETEWKW
jgi:antitoxin MazE